MTLRKMRNPPLPPLARLLRQSNPQSNPRWESTARLIDQLVREILESFIHCDGLTDIALRNIASGQGPTGEIRKLNNIDVSLYAHFLTYGGTLWLIAS